MPDVSTQATPAHACSKGTVNPALRIFKVPPTDISINAYRMVTIQPTTTGINPMEFIVPGLDDFVHLGCSSFTMELSLKKSNNANLVANEKLWPVNNSAHSIIKQIDLQLNGTLISPQSDTYHCKAYLETLLNYDREDGKTMLGPQGWFNQVDFPPQWTNNNSDKAGDHLDWQNLSANHKVAYEASVVETAKYAAGVTHSLVFTPHLEVFGSCSVTPKGKTTSKIPIKKGSSSTSRGDDISRRLEGKAPAREVERLKPLPGWEDWTEAKNYDVGWITTVTKDDHQEKTDLPEEKEYQTETHPTRRGIGCAKMDR